MDEYEVRFVRSAHRELESLPMVVLQRIFPQIEHLAQEPRPRGCRKLQGEENTWRIRIGDYRVIYTVDDKERQVDIMAVRHRNHAYR
ncbi:type II toxin-antitoxin system RelE family toxin [Candidatus Entotheonella palauensis]|uniref:Plasmid stabilization protein n=1 Tax=Candidatus Entotheonella gemina TaxID=1429439 RepID=W4M214_9BACT|nr:type II toxin-antitoxin system RelE/ParE family toxin [Candidatus Entotheonella palauensis]ETX03697.1 MAG: hypothetical protein ETSY2_32770 [Candidatus Entotheonella gemina]